MNDTGRGIYVLANDRVVEHAIALLNSIRRWDANTPVCLIPYDGAHAALERLAGEHGIAVWRDAALLEWVDRALIGAFPAGFFRRPGNFRKQACWFGPFREFLYLDADIIVFEPIAGLLDALADADFICCDDQHEGGLTHVFNASIRGERGFGRRVLGDVFNGGLFGARAGAITAEVLEATFAEAARHPHWFDWSRGGTDQPILNYLVLGHLPRRVNVYRDRRREPRMWAGTPGFEPDGERLVDPRVGRPLRFLHWAGRPIGPGGPYFEIWRHYRELDPRRPPCALPPVSPQPAPPPRPGIVERLLARIAAR